MFAFLFSLAENCLRPLPSLAHKFKFRLRCILSKTLQGELRPHLYFYFFNI